VVLINNAMKNVESLVNQPLEIPFLGPYGELFEAITDQSVFNSSSFYAFNDSTGKIDSANASDFIYYLNSGDTIGKTYKRLSNDSKNYVMGTGSDSTTHFKYGTYFQLDSDGVPQEIGSLDDFETAAAQGDVYQIKTVYRNMHDRFQDAYTLGRDGDGVSSSGSKSYPPLTETGTPLFDVQYNILTASADYGGNSTTEDLVRGVEQAFISPDFFTVTINEEGFNKYINGVRDAVNQVTFLFQIANAYTEAQLYTGMQIGDIDLNSEEKRDSDKDRKKIRFGNR